MRSAVIATIAAIALTACGDRATPSATFDEASRPALNAGSDSCSPLPANVAIDIPHQLRSDTFYVNKNGVVRRRVVVQFLEGDVAAATASMNKSMQSAGFHLVDSRNAVNQRVHVRFQKKGYGMAHVFFEPTPNAVAATPVRGSITFDLPPPSFNAAVAAKPAGSR